MRNVGQLVSEKLLPRVANPGQYVGLETNACCGDAESADVTVAMAFPDTYGIGISHLGSQLLYHQLNAMDGVACDRTYCPLPDAEQVMREQDVPLFGWESRSALADFDIIGFSLGYELCVTNVLTMLDLAGIPLHAADRGDKHPLIVGGDALADSPEPLAPFFDIFLPGDGEEPMKAMVELLREAKQQGLSRRELLLTTARTLPFAYVPSFYEPQYDPQGRLTGLTPTETDIPETIRRACLERLADAPIPEAPLVPLSEGVQERVIIEVMRGCPNACRFCQAGATRLPVRSRWVDEIVDAARSALANTGYREISLLSLSTSDYPFLDELIDRLNAEFAPQNVSISLPSLRVDKQLRYLPRLTSTVRKGGLTIAAEAGTPRMRKAIRKSITEEDMIEGVKAAYAAGYQKVKVYFMAGLPGETERDIEQIFWLSYRMSLARKEVDSRKGSINASVSWFVPKPHTPMQWAPMQTEDYFWWVRNKLRDMARRKSVNVKFHRIERSLLEGFLARGDRRVAKVVEAAWRDGARFDSWEEHFDYDRWQRACEKTGVDPDFYRREFSVDEFLPWSHIICRRRTPFLLEQRQEMLDALAEEDIDPHHSNAG
ncbi:MAG: TIGR03960 family B12-binding radical SAM protein [Phycisphaerae bacterium]